MIITDGGIQNSKKARIILPAVESKTKYYLANLHYGNSKTWARDNNKYVPQIMHVLFFYFS